jgi:hypothetical protein
VTLVLEQSGETITGSLETMLGNGQIDTGRVSGSKLKANTNMDIQGQSVEFSIAGTIDGDTMSGEINAPALIPTPLTFAGAREG